MNILSSKVRKEWLNWSFQELGKDSVLEEKLEKSVLSWLRDKKKSLGPSLSFEKKILNENEIFQAIESVVDLLDRDFYFAVVGESDAPVVLVVAKEKMKKFIAKAVNSKRPWNFSSASNNGSILFAPEIDSAEKDLLVSASGEFESAIEELKTILPGGTVFRGN